MNFCFALRSCISEYAIGSVNESIGIFLIAFSETILNVNEWLDCHFIATLESLPLQPISNLNYILLITFVFFLLTFTQQNPNCKQFIRSISKTTKWEHCYANQPICNNKSVMLFHVQCAVLLKKVAFSWMFFHCRCNFHVVESMTCYVVVQIARGDYLN